MKKARAERQCRQSPKNEGWQLASKLIIVVLHCRVDIQLFLINLLLCLLKAPILKNGL